MSMTLQQKKNVTHYLMVNGSLYLSQTNKVLSFFLLSVLVFSNLFTFVNVDCENSRGVPEEDSPGFCRLNYKDQYLSPQIRL